MIHFLEKKLKLDLKYFFNGGSWLFAGQAVSVFKSLFISVFLARFFGLEEFGKYVYIMAIFSVVNIFGAPGMSIALFQSVSRGYEGTLGYLAKKVFFIGLWGSVALALFQIYFNFIQGEANHFVFLVLAIIFPFYSVGTNFAYYISGIKKFKERTSFELVMNVFIIASFFVAFIFKKDIYYSLIVLILSQTIISLAYVYYLIKHSNNKIDYDSYEYGRKLNWNYVIPTLKIQLDRVLISNLLGYSHVATYSVATSFSDQVPAMAKVLGALIVPKSSVLTEEEVKDKLCFKNILIILALFFSMSFILIILVPVLIKILYGDSYSGAILFAQVILFFMPLRSLSLILRNINESQKNTKIIAKLSNQMSIIEALLMLFGLLLFQVWGLIFAKIIADCIGVAWQLISIHRKKIN